MTSEKVELEFIADTAGVDAGFDKLDAGLRDVDKAVQNASSSVSSFFSVFAGSFAAGVAQGALKELAGAFAALPEVIARGSQIDDITASFEDLATKAGASADALINGFSKALGDTVPKVDLMRQANELLNGGIDPTEFNDLAAAARSLAEVTGGSATEGLDQLSDALLRGRTMGLKAIGVVVDNEAAVTKYAEALGVTKEALGEQDKIEAIRIATLEALAKKRGELAAVEDDAADKIDQMTVNIQNQTDAILRSVATDESLVSVLDRMAVAVSAIEFGPLIQDIVTISGAIISMTVSVGESAAKMLQYVPVIRDVGNALGELRDVIQKGAFLIKFFNTDGEKNQALVMSQLVKELGINLKTTGAAATQFAGATDQAAETEARMAKATAENVARIKEAQAALDKQKGALDAKKKAEQDAAEAVKEAAAEEKKRAEEAKKALESLNQTVISSEKYERILKDLKDESISAGDAGERIKDLYRETSQNVKDLNAATELYNGLLAAVGRGANVAADDLAKAATEVERLSEAVKGAAKKTGGGSFLDLLVGEGLDPGQSQVATAIGSALSSAITEAINSGDVGSAIKNAGSSMGQALGSAAGASLGPIGAAVGGSIGQALADKFIKGVEGIGKSSQGTGKGIKTILDSIFPGIGSGLDFLIGDKLFGGDSKGTQTRKQVDKFFADAFDAQRLMVIIEGQLQQITDLDLGGGLFGDAGSAAGEFFAGLEADAQNGFSAVAQGFAQMLGVGEEAAAGLAIAFADNLGGSLNNLQLLVEATGLSFEQMREQVVSAFLDGKLSALEAQTALNGIAQVSQKGIPDGVGMISQAFDNMKAAGTKGGRALIDAIQDIGFEAKELGQKDLSQVVTALAATGKYSTEEIQQVFNALKANGITTVEQLTSATTEQLLPVLAELENTKFPFAEQVKDVRAYIEAVESIPTNKDVQLNLKVNYANSADQKVVQDLAGRGAIGQGSATL